MLANWLTFGEWSSRKVAEKRYGNASSDVAKSETYADYVGMKVNKALDEGLITEDEGLYILTKAEENMKKKPSGTRRGR